MAHIGGVTANGVESGRIVDAGEAGERLDLWLARRRPEHSRARWQQLIRAGGVRVNGRPSKPHRRLAAGERVSWTEPEPMRETPLIAEDIPLHILFEDEEMVVLDKPPGLVVHPAPGHESGTLVNALLHHCADLAGIGGERRPGIVHRLDRDTSGVMVAAKTERAMTALQRQFRARRVRKEYRALVWGCPEPPVGRIETLIGRSPAHRKKMSARVATGRPAVTHYEVLETYETVSLLALRIETGRTHQIRVHLAHIGHPVVGDPIYGRGRRGALPLPAGRQMLHAASLAFDHPRTGERLEFVAPMPSDMHALITALRAEKSATASNP